MMAARILSGAILSALFATAGCVPATQLNESLTQNRSLASQNRAQLAEIDNMRARMRELKQQVAEAEEQLAKRDSRSDSSLGKLSDALNTPDTPGWTSRPQPTASEAKNGLR